MSSHTISLGRHHSFTFKKPRMMTDRASAWRRTCIAARLLPTRVPVPGLGSPQALVMTSVQGDVDRHPHKLYRRCCACRGGRISSWPWPRAGGSRGLVRLSRRDLPRESDTQQGCCQDGQHPCGPEGRVLILIVGLTGKRPLRWSEITKQLPPHPIDSQSEPGQIACCLCWRTHYHLAHRGHFLQLAKASSPNGSRAAGDGEEPRHP